MQKDMLFWIWLSEALGAASRDFSRLIAVYENPYDLFLAETEEIERIPSLAPKTYAALCNKDLQRATEILEKCERLNIGILPYTHKEYPAALREIQKPPVLLYFRGTLPDLNRSLSVGMVGTRSMSRYGMENGYRLAYTLAGAGAVVVSGMAAGIDGVCAAAAMAAGGKTVAVLGCGPDVTYPRHHQKLMEKIMENGAVISEYPPMTPPSHYHFPVRNRLISGISRGTVVVEAGVGSGSLITAKEAVVQGREVFALPANVGSRGAEGTNSLLRDGAKVVQDATDVLRPFLHVYAESLRTEKMTSLKEQAQVDLRYLESLGVISLGEQTLVPSTRRKEPSSSAPKASVQKPVQAKQKTEGEIPAPVSTANPAPRAEPKREVQAARNETPAKTERRETPDQVLSSLTPVQLGVLQAIPDDRAVTADSLSGLGYPYGDVIAALTMLEILGLIQKLPGALYTKS